MEMQLNIQPQGRVTQRLTAPATIPPQFEGVAREAVDVGRFRAAVVRNFHLVLAPVVLALLGAVGYLIVTPSRYQATTQLLIDSPQPKILRGESAVSGLDPNRFTIGPVIDSAVEILQSEPLAERVIRKAKLHRDPSFARGGVLSRLTDPPKDFVKSALVRFGIMRKPKPRPDVPLALIKKLQANLDAKRKGLSLIVHIKYTDRSPERAAMIANEVANQFLLEQRESKVRIMKRVNERLRGQLDQMRAQVVTADQRLNDFRMANNLTVVGGMTAGDRELADTMQQLTATRAELAGKLAEKEEAERISADPSSVVSMGRVMRSEVITGLRRQEAEVTRKIALLVSQFGPQHHQVERARAEVRDLQREIDAEVARVVQNARNELQLAASRVKLVEQKLEELKADTARRNALNIKLAELERHAKSASDLYFALMTRLEETQAQESLLYEDSQIIAIATAPDVPVAPRAITVLGLALLLGAGLGVAFALLKDHFSRTLHSPEDVEAAIGQPPLAAIRDTDAPKADRAPSGIAKAQLLQHFFALRQWLIAAPNVIPGSVAVVTAPHDDAEKTAVAIGLAQYAHRAGVRTLLIDANPARDRLTRTLVPEAKAGILDVLAGRAALEAATVTEPGSGLRICPLVGEDDDPITTLELLTGGRMGGLLAEARKDHALVIVDTRGLIGSAEARGLVDHANAVLLVLCAGRTTADDVTRMKSLIPSLTSKRVGLVLTQVADDEHINWADIGRRLAGVAGRIGQSYRAIRDWRFRKPAGGKPAEA